VNANGSHSTLLAQAGPFRVGQPPARLFPAGLEGRFYFDFSQLPEETAADTPPLKKKRPRAAFLSLICFRSEIVFNTETNFPQRCVGNAGLRCRREELVELVLVINRVQSEVNHAECAREALLAQDAPVIIEQIADILDDHKRGEIMLRPE